MPARSSQHNGPNGRGPSPGPQFDRRAKFVFLSAVSWDSVIAGRTKGLAQAVSDMHLPCLFAEMPSLRRAAKRLASPRARGSASDGSDVQVVRVCPMPGLAAVSWSFLGRAWCGRAVERLSSQLGDAVTVVVATTPWWAPVAAALGADVLCYDCNDHVSIHAPRWPAAVRNRWHRELLSAADVVTVVSPALRAECARTVDPSRLHLVPNGVDEGWFAEPVTPIPASRSAGGTDRPVAGFVGSLYEWVDLALLQRCAESLPEIDFIIVGPTRLGVSLSRLESIPNLRRIGPQPYSQVRRWIAAFDVCLVPFKRDVINDMADPLKLYEYCALGKPIVSTCRAGSVEPPPACYFAESAGQFIGAIRRALEEDSAERAADRVAYARANTWRRRAEQLVAAVRGRWQRDQGSGPVAERDAGGEART